MGPEQPCHDRGPVGLHAHHYVELPAVCAETSWRSSALDNRSGVCDLGHLPHIAGRSFMVDAQVGVNERREQRPDGQVNQSMATRWGSCWIHAAHDCQEVTNGTDHKAIYRSSSTPETAGKAIAEGGREYRQIAVIMPASVAFNKSTNSMKTLKAHPAATPLEAPLCATLSVITTTRMEHAAVERWTCARRNAIAGAWLKEREGNRWRWLPSGVERNFELGNFCRDSRVAASVVSPR